VRTLASRGEGRKDWYLRAVFVIWFIGAVIILVVFKNMELIVHGQLYYYGLVFSPEWADSYRVFTWLIYSFLGLQMALSGVALISTFVKAEEAPESKSVVQQSVKQPHVVKAGSRPVVRETPKTVENTNVRGITCPYCKKVFSRALVMLDFSGGKNRLVSVCPYCNKVLGINGKEKSTNDNVSVVPPGEKITH
jgi:uncharacterized Zn-finger protein